MNTIKFNNSTFPVETYNKNTYLAGGIIAHDCNCTINNANVEALHALMSETITSICIYHDGNLIYNDDNLNVTIGSVNEYLTEDRVVMSINLKFDN